MTDNIIYSVVTIVTPVGPGDAAPQIEIPPKSMVAETIVDPAGKSDETVAMAICRDACRVNSVKLFKQMNDIMYPTPPDQFPEIDDVLPKEEKKFLI